MHGTLQFPMTERLAENVRAHGVAWTAQWCKRQGFTLTETQCLMRGALRGWVFVV